MREMVNQLKLDSFGFASLPPMRTLPNLDSIAHRHTARHNTVSTLANHPILSRNKLLSVLNMVRNASGLTKSSIMAPAIRINAGQNARCFRS